MSVYFAVSSYYLQRSDRTDVVVGSKKRKQWNKQALETRKAGKKGKKTRLEGEVQGKEVEEKEQEGGKERFQERGEKTREIKK